MTLPSQFSLEEENFYKDIQDLVKKGTQNEKELSLFLERYKDLLARSDLDDETFIINFAKAGLIIEASAKLYGIKVDNLWVNLEHVLESLKSKGQIQNNKKRLECENDEGLDDCAFTDLQEDYKRKNLAFSKRRKKVDAFYTSDDFIEVDNITGLLGKNMNESFTSIEGKVRLCEKAPNMFIKNKTKRKKMDIFFNKSLDYKDVIRLRDWIFTAECLLVKEIYTKIPENILNLDNAFEHNQIKNGFESESYNNNGSLHYPCEELSLVQKNIKFASGLKDETNNNIETDLTPPNQNLDVSESNDKIITNELKEDFIKDLNISRESDLAKFPNVLEKMTEDCIVDVDEIFWNPSKFQDVISSKKMRSGKTNKLTCQLCVDKKLHKKKGKKCLDNKKIECLDSFFTPYVQPILSEPHCGTLPDEELLSAYKTEMRLIEQLKKIGSCKNSNDVYYPNENMEGLRNFLGFDGFEDDLLKKPELLEDEGAAYNLAVAEVEDLDYEESNADNEIELPFPTTENDGGLNCNLRESNMAEIAKENTIVVESEYHKLVSEELKDHYAAKSSFAKSKELGVKIFKWYEMIADKIKLSQNRGALNMKFLANKIMTSFPKYANRQKPVLAFQDLVKKQCQRDVPRYFFACLQLANEGNLEIYKSNAKSLATDCMLITQLKVPTLNDDSNDNSVLSPSPGLISPDAAELHQVKAKRKRNSSNSPTIDIVLGKQKKPKQKIVETCKRPKNFNSLNSLKRRRCSMISVDSWASE